MAATPKPVRKAMKYASKKAETKTESSLAKQYYKKHPENVTRKGKGSHPDSAQVPYREQFGRFKKKSKAK